MDITDVLPAKAGIQFLKRLLMNLSRIWGLNLGCGVLPNLSDSFGIRLLSGGDKPRHYKRSFTGSVGAGLNPEPGTDHFGHCPFAKPATRNSNL